MNVIDKIEKLFEAESFEVPTAVLKAVADTVGKHLKVKIPALKRLQASGSYTRYGVTVKDTNGVHAQLLKEPVYLIVFDFREEKESTGFPGGFGVYVDLKWEYRAASNGFGVMRAFIDESGKMYGVNFNR